MKNVELLYRVLMLAEDQVNPMMQVQTNVIT